MTNMTIVMMAMTIVMTRMSIVMRLMAIVIVIVTWTGAPTFEILVHQSVDYVRAAHPGFVLPVLHKIICGHAQALQTG